MIVPDINLLIYAHNDQASEYAKARAWWEVALNGNTPVGIPWISISGFIRLMIHPRVLAQPMDIAQAELYSCDSDFSRFPGLRWRNPLV